VKIPLHENDIAKKNIQKDYGLASMGITGKV
jgi:hypothetical protein